MKKINKRIPGLLPLPPKAEVDGKLAELSSKSITELLELKVRQTKLLNNKLFVSKLPDKGAKIQALYDKISNELKNKQEDETCGMLGDLKLDTVDSQLVQQVEWVGKIDENNQTYLDSDDDSEPEDELTILSQNTFHEKKIRVLKPEKMLVTPEDLEIIGESAHVKYIVNKTENNSKTKATGQFKPYKTTKSNVHNPEKEIHRPKHAHWEVTAATPPPIIHGPAKILSIEDSLKLQQDYNDKLKEISVKHAAEKLAALTGIKLGDIPNDTTKFGEYREVDSDDSDSEKDGSDNEVHDEEPEKGGVVFTVMK